MAEQVPVPEVTPLTAPYWEGLTAGELRFQRCGACRNAWLPAREECPRCLSDDVSWEGSAGRGKVVSWVVYHQAVHPAFADRVPYTVGVVELDEGPRLISGLQVPDGALAIELPVAVRIEDESGVRVPRFAPV